MKFLRHKQRHIVVTALDDDITELPEKVSVIGRVGLDASVQGHARRGRPPTYAKPIDSKELEFVDMSQVDQKMLDAALKLLGDVSKAGDDGEAQAKPAIAVPEAPGFENAETEYVADASEEVIDAVFDDDESDVIPMDAE